ncbi:leader peptidase (prepilin peptidase)/N-methyltransferase [Natronocella acetinitrilica]|uniref:Prepilin leader peptidase/N-methyltransferase n=1 Tax=Natronocella acetinitrilica TaxID=414046 RepID=A0AAE3G145_9GAMM|nr:A24 family peptidase [Natronocella acetinitrilica]MCP1673840.1 leader peptidase (prepilin peptidase)/N-methyltransferase [Natronocella acetinitrilica]
MSALAALEHSPALLITATLLLGLLVGSFLNVVILRAPQMLFREWRAQAREILEQPADSADTEPFNLVRPASHCPNCGHGIKPWENIPVLSWVVLRGKCSGCGAAISPRYPAVELATGLLSAIVAWQLGWGVELFPALILTWVLIALSGIDIDHQILPDNMTLPALWLGLILALVPVFVSPTDAILGAVAGYLSLWLVFQAFRLATGKEGMGYGDFKLLALLGAWLGWAALPVIILLSALVGAVAGILMILLLGRDRQLPIPFGPYLAGAGWLALLWGDDLTNFYLSISGLA